jgi:hypothetical protein
MAKKEGPKLYRDPETGEYVEDIDAEIIDDDDFGDLSEEEEAELERELRREELRKKRLKRKKKGGRSRKSSRSRGMDFDKKSDDPAWEELPKEGEYEKIHQATGNAFLTHKDAIVDVLYDVSHEAIYRIGWGRMAMSGVRKAYDFTLDAFKTKILGMDK